MSFRIKDKFAAEVPEDLDNHDTAEAPEGALEAPAGDYSAQVHPPAPVDPAAAWANVDARVEATTAAEAGSPDSGEEAPA